MKVEDDIGWCLLLYIDTYLLYGISQKFCLIRYLSTDVSLVVTLLVLSVYYPHRFDTRVYSLPGNSRVYMWWWATLSTIQTNPKNHPPTISIRAEDAPGLLVPVLIDLSSLLHGAIVFVKLYGERAGYNTVESLLQRGGADSSYGKIFNQGTFPLLSRLSVVRSFS